jgi:hypothetical protein
VTSSKIDDVVQIDIQPEKTANNTPLDAIANTQI